MENNNKKTSTDNNKHILKRFIVSLAVLLLTVTAVVIFFDPFYHFHAPIGFKAVLNQPEYQCIGTIKNFNYDSVIVGSSMAENYNNKDFDNRFGCKTVKAIKTSGTVPDLMYYLNVAFETHKISNVFYSLDVTSLMNETTASFLDDEKIPHYLYDENPFNDVKYIFNKDVIFEDIPYMLAMNFSGDFEEGKSYNWAKYKSFSLNDAINHYERPEKQPQMFSEEVYKPVIGENIELIKNMIEEHPDTSFYIFIPTYSVLWWDACERQGIYEESLYAIEQILNTFTAYDNVNFYNFLSDREISFNLDNYTDQVHFKEEINSLIVERLYTGEYLVDEFHSTESYEAILETASKALNEERLKYFDE